MILSVPYHTPRGTVLQSHRIALHATRPIPNSAPNSRYEVNPGAGRRTIRYLLVVSVEIRIRPLLPALVDLVLQIDPNPPRVPRAHHVARFDVPID